MTARVIEPGPLALVQDLGRPGASGLGLGPGGALDRTALRAANALVGNPASSAALEILLGGFSLRFLEPAMVSVTGARGELRIDGELVQQHVAHAVAAGSRVSIGTASAGLRFYLAVAGGVATEELAGSRSRDVLAGMGPPPLSAGQLLSFGRLAFSEGSGNSPQRAQVLRDPPRGERSISLRLTPGPRLDWFAPGAWAALLAQPWSISAESNRIAARLMGRPLEFARTEQLLSEGMVSGALQVPPSGLPMIFLADHPVTGGYPVIAVVRGADLDLLGQAQPGQRLNFLQG
ncbi:biotin-dependent carboxyltransferase family protein [Psychromicrobium sp. YIM B11713]|uniref:5-oxoprolinase subunit C family protein n=1 Tax=Psychromicrobium sp. YIM B11713 TaxID=3145233 RepID=UPI00374ED3FA